MDYLHYFFIINNGKLNRDNDNSDICDSSFSGSKHFFLSGTNRKETYINVRDVLCIMFSGNLDLCT